MLIRNSVPSYVQALYQRQAAGDLRRRLVLLSGAVGVGLVAVGFAWLAERAGQLFEHIVRFSPWLPLLITPLGFAFSVWCTQRFFPAAAGSGIPQTIATLEGASGDMRRAVLSVPAALGKVLLTSLGLLCGASIGREGPTVQVGAAIMYALRRFARFPSHDRERGLILAGGAAGIGAAFNTPLAGVVFAIEEMSGSFERHTNGTVLTAVILAGITALGLDGNYSYFGSTSATLDWGYAWFAMVACGVAGGAVGGLFSRALVMLPDCLPPRIKAWRLRHPIYFGAACGLLVALLGLASSGTVYGTGYAQARAMVAGTQGITPGFALWKIAATLMSQLSGMPGGLFSPSLAIGAGLGYDLSQLIHVAQPGAIVILCMMAYLSGVIQAPITSFVIMMEMTNDHAMILPLMAASVIASAVSKRICPQPLYKQLAYRFIAQRQAANETESADNMPPDPLVEHGK